MVRDTFDSFALFIVSIQVLQQILYQMELLVVPKGYCKNMVE